MRALGALLALLLTACAAAAPPHPNPEVEQLARLWEQLAFGYEYQSGGETIRKWDVSVPVRIQVNGEGADYARDVASTLRNVTGLTVDVVQRGGNVRVNVLPPARYTEERQRHGMPSFVSCFGTGGPGDITIYMNTAMQADARKTWHCWHEEIIQGVSGLHNDAKDVPVGYSLFREGGPASHLTDADRRVIRAHFDSRIRPGMSKSQAGLVIRQILSEIVTARQ